jgi:hypothetical protein
VNRLIGGACRILRVIVVQSAEEGSAVLEVDHRQ